MMGGTDVLSASGTSVAVFAGMTCLRLASLSCEAAPCGFESLGAFSV